MYPDAPYADPPGLAHRGRSWLGRAEDWLDDRGKAAWIAATVLGFIVFWPVGLGLLGYMIWRKKGMFCNHRHGRNASRMQARFGTFRSSGNSAFDAYKADTLDRLQREQEEFEAFLRRLRESKDKAEFDQYMNERARAHAAGDDTAAPGPDRPTPLPGA